MGKKLICVLRVKDGIFFAEQWLNRMESLVDEIVVVDNGSTDGTYEILQNHPKVVDIVRTEGFDEGRDKNLVYEHARKRNPDWMLWLDIDEIFEEEFTRKDLENLMNSSVFNKFSFRRFHFIDRDFYAASTKWLYYSSSHDRVLWRESPKGFFENVIIDSPNVKGIGGLTWPTHFRIKHLGYINKDLVDVKANIYLKIAPEKEKTIQGMYFEGVKGWPWIKSRRSIKLFFLDFLLDMMLIYKKLILAIRKLVGLFSKN